MCFHKHLCYIYTLLKLFKHSGSTMEMALVPVGNQSMVPSDNSVNSKVIQVTNIAPQATRWLFNKCLFLSYFFLPIQQPITDCLISGIKCTPCSLFLGRLRTFVSTRHSGQRHNYFLSNNFKKTYIFWHFVFRDASVSIQSRCCYLKFLDEGVLPISLHMTNTVFIDRAIIVQVNFCLNCENQLQILCWNGFWK